MSNDTHTKHDPETMRRKALGHFASMAAQHHLGFSQTELTSLIGMTPDEVLENGIDPQSENGIRAVSLGIIARCLKALIGDDQDNLRHWMQTHNKHFGCSPRALMLNNPETGIVQVRDYCEWMEHQPG